jgi:hypothetical protein
MNILFHKMRTGKKGQIAAVLTLALVIFVIAAFLVVNLGKNKIQDNRVKNAAQAGVLAGGSSASVLLNSMANLNDNMILNFAGFTLMVQIVITSWIIDYVKLLIVAYSTYQAFNWKSLVDVVFAVMTLGLTTATLALLITGARTIGDSIKRMIDELNDKLPKSSRDSARQYALSNAGVDESKIPFSKSGCADAWCYSLIETKFDMFMRVLPTNNKADPNYGASTIEFDWDDSRNQNIVNNKLSVTVTPVPKVPFRLMTLSEIAGESGAINAYLSEKDMSWLGPLITFGVNRADLIIALVATIAVMINLLSVILGIVAVILGILAVAYWTTCFSCSWAYCVCCWACAYGAYYTAATIVVLGTIVYATKASSVFYDVGSLPCFVWEQRTEHPISVEVTRTTSPASINYGIYTTDWPVKTQSASGAVKDGNIFPPNQNFDIIPNF